MKLISATTSILFSFVFFSNVTAQAEPSFKWNWKQHAFTIPGTKTNGKFTHNPVYFRMDLPLKPKAPISAASGQKTSTGDYHGERKPVVYWMVWHADKPRDESQSAKYGADRAAELWRTDSTTKYSDISKIEVAIEGAQTEAITSQYTTSKGLRLTTVFLSLVVGRCPISVTIEYDASDAEAIEAVTKMLNSIKVSSPAPKSQA